MRIGIVGGGVVGRATARCYLEHVDEVRVYDVVGERATHSLEETLECSLVLVCLPETTLDEFFDANPFSGVNYVLRSTVPIGTTRRLRKEYNLNIIHSPEFLTERCAITDAQMPARNVIGVPYDVGHERASTVIGPLRRLYERRFPSVQVLTMTSDESEAVKLMTNAFFACKISIFNEFMCLADELGLDWDSVIEGILSDGRIAHSHTAVPGPDGKRGFGGKCLPKDLEMLFDQFKDKNEAQVIDAVIGRNNRDRERTL